MPMSERTWSPTKLDPSLPFWLIPFAKHTRNNPRALILVIGKDFTSTQIIQIGSVYPNIICRPYLDSAHFQYPTKHFGLLCMHESGQFSIKHSILQHGWSGYGVNTMFTHVSVNLGHLTCNHSESRPSVPSTPAQRAGAIQRSELFL